MKLNALLHSELVITDSDKGTAEELLSDMVQRLKSKDRVNNEKLVLNKLLEREKLGSTSIGNHAAIPHAKVKELKDPVVTLALSRKGIQYHPNDEKAVHLIILILSPNDTPITHLQILAAAASLIKNSDSLVPDLLKTRSGEDVIALIKQYEGRHD